MSSTNKTSHYNLSQYVGTDKPTYLADYNSDMSNIDTGIYGAKSTADTNTNAIGTLSGLTTEAKSNLVGAINEVDAHADTNAGNITTNATNIASNTSHIGVMANLETTEKSNLVGAINEVKYNVDNFNLTSYTTLDTQNMTIVNGSISLGSITIAKNSDGSLAKIYGLISMSYSGNGTCVITISGTGLSPTSEFTINNAGMYRGHLSGDYYVPAGFDITIKTNGNIEIRRDPYGNDVGVFFLFPMLYFIKDFGDSPLPE